MDKKISNPLILFSTWKPITQRQINFSRRRLKTFHKPLIQYFGVNTKEQDKFLCKERKIEVDRGLRIKPEQNNLKARW